MPRFALGAVGADRPGIVAGVSGALVDLGGNLEDSTMTILQGYFAILLVVSVPPAVSARLLESALAPVAERFGLVLSVWPLAEESVTQAESAPAASPWTIAVHGADRTGIVHGVTTALAEVGGNVVDLGTHLVGSAEAPVYVMTLRVTLPEHPDPAAAVRRVQEAAEALGVHCTVHPDEADTL
jgi:glycine cleavage system transcriptional repressor